jgi:hypothetical protein
MLVRGDEIAATNLEALRLRREAVAQKVGPGIAAKWPVLEQPDECPVRRHVGPSGVGRALAGLGPAAERVGGERQHLARVALPGQRPCPEPAGRVAARDPGSRILEADEASLLNLAWSEERPQDAIRQGTHRLAGVRATEEHLHP